MRYPLVEPWTVRWSCQEKRQLAKEWACEQNARGLETVVGGKDPEELNSAPRGPVGIEEGPR